MRQRVVVADLHGRVPRIPECPIAEEPLIDRLARPQRHHGQIPIRQLVRNLRHQVEAFLFRKPRNNPYHRRLLRHLLQSKGTQQIGPALPLARQIVHRIVRREVAVRGRAPLGIVHAVQNPAQVRRPREQHAVQLLPKLRRLNLLGILAAHGGQNVGVNQPALEKVEVIELLHQVHGEDLPRKQQPLSGNRRKQPLVGGIVNGQHHTGVLQHGIGLVNRAQVNRNKRCLPVVNMEDLGHSQQLGRLQHRAAKQPESLPIVGIIRCLGPIKSLPVEKLRAIHKVVLNTAPPAPVHDPRKPVVVLEWNGDRPRRILPLALDVRLHRSIQRQVDGNLVPQLHQLRPQRAHHVGQPAGLDKRNTLRSGKDNVHRIDLPGWLLRLPKAASASAQERSETPTPLRPG